MKHLIVSFFSLACVGAVSAANTCTWTGGSGNWNDDANWKDGLKPSAGDTVILEPSASGVEIVNDMGAISLAQIRFTKTNAMRLSSAETITLTGAEPLIFASSGAYTNAAPLAFTQSTAKLSFYGEARTVVLAGSMSGSNVVYSASNSGQTKAIITGANTYTGGTKWLMCALNARNVAAFGTNYGLVECTAGSGGLTLGVAGVWKCGYKPNSGIPFNTVSGIELAGPLVMPEAQTNTIQVGDNQKLTVSGPISGGCVYFSGYSSGTVTLSGENTHLGTKLRNVGLVATNAKALGGFLDAWDNGGSGDITLDAAGTWPTEKIWVRPSGNFKILKTCTFSGDFYFSANETKKVHFQYNVADNLKNKVTFNGAIHGGTVDFIGYSVNAVVLNGANDHAGTKVQMMATTLGHTNAIGKAGATLHVYGGGSGVIGFNAAGDYRANLSFASNNRMNFWKSVNIYGWYSNTWDSSQNFYVNSGCVVHFWGEVVKKSGLIYQGIQGDVNANGLHFHGPVKVYGIYNGSFVGSAHGPLYLYSPLNEISSYIKLGYTSNIRCAGENVLSGTPYIYWNGDVNPGMLDLNGYDQTANRLMEDAPFALQSGARYITNSSSTPATLTLRGTADGAAGCLVEKAVTLVWNPTGDYTQTISGRVNTATGDLIVSNGTFRIPGATTFKNVPRIAVGPNGTFDLSTTTAGAFAGLTTLEVDGTLSAANAVTPFTDGQVALKVGEDASLALPNATRVKALYVKGVRQVPGTYTRDGAGGTKVLAQLADGISLVVAVSEWETTDATWQEGGVNVNLSDASNWVEGEQDFTTGGLNGTFGVGSAATVDKNVVMKGLVFDGVTTFAISGDYKLTLREFGFTLGDNETVTVSAPLEIATAQTWTIGSGSRLNISGGLTATTGNEKITKVGRGDLWLNSEAGDVGSFSLGTAIGWNGRVVVNVATNAFGTASDTKKVDIYGVTAYASPRPNGSLCFNTSSVVERPVEIHSSNAYHDMRVEAGRTVRFTKLVTQSVGAARQYFDLGATVIFEGGFYGPNWMCYEGNSKVIIRNKRADVAYYLLDGTSIDIETTNNSFRGFQIQGAAVVHAKVPNAVVMGKERFYLQNSSAAFWATGDQTIGLLMGFSGGAITSDVPSRVTCNHYYVNSSSWGLTSKPVTNYSVRITGDVLFYKKGDLMFAQNCTANTTGGIGVGEGRLQILSGASFPNARTFIADGSGSLEIEAADKLNHRATLTVGDKATVTLSADQRVRTLIVDGETMPGGIYTADGADGTIKATWLKGTGKLTVRPAQGLMLLIK